MNDSPGAAWLPQIESAHTGAELAHTLRAYLASLTPQQLAELPKECSPQAFAGPADIQEWAVMLTHADLKVNGSPRASATLHQAAVIFAAAGSKLTKVAE
jgi:hypothetical protein